MSELMHFNPNHDKLGRFSFSKYKNPDGSLTQAGQIRAIKKLEKKDNRWAKSHYNSLYKKAYKPAKKEMKEYTKKYLNTKYSDQLKRGVISKRYMNEYNKKLASLMNMNTSILPTSPSGRVVSFIAKRGELGVHMALSDINFDMSQFKSGIYGSGRVAYKKNVVNRMEI